MTEYKCGSAESCKYGDMCKPNFNIGACSHYKAEEPQTNEKWLRNLSFNEFARVLYCMIINGERIRPDLAYIKQWLKEIHE